MFEDKHPPFYEKEYQQFMTSHLNTPVIQWSHSDTMIDYSNNREQSVIYPEESIEEESDEEESSEEESDDGDTSVSINHIYVPNEDDLDSLD